MLLKVHPPHHRHRRRHGKPHQETIFGAAEGRSGSPLGLCRRPAGGGRGEAVTALSSFCSAEESVHHIRRRSPQCRLFLSIGIFYHVGHRWRSLFCTGNESDKC